MRLSCLVTFLLFFSFPLLAQHSSGASGSGGGSHSSGASFGGSVSSSSGHASFGSSGASHGSGGSHSRVAAPQTRSNLATTTSQRSPLEKRHFFSLPWHKKTSSQFVSWRPTPCLNGHNCTPCRAGSRSGVGMCSQPQNVSCFAGQAWGGSYCQNWWGDECAGLASQLEAQRRHMQGLNDPGQSLVYQVLGNQYTSCLSRQGLGLGFYALNDRSLFNIP